MGALMTKECITIYTDASVCNSSKAGGWACWVKYGRGNTFIASGSFKADVGDSTDAELRAIANSLSVVIGRLRPSNSVFVIVTDSKMSIGYITGAIKKPGKGTDKEKFKTKHAIACKIREMVPSDCEIRMRKVKSHSDKDGARSYVNNLVDHVARQEMRKKRDGCAV